MVFHEKDRRVMPSHHGMPFYVIASIYDMRLRHALIDPGRAFEHPTSTHAKGNPSREIVEQLIEVVRL